MKRLMLILAFTVLCAVTYAQSVRYELKDSKGEKNVLVIDYELMVLTWNPGTGYSGRFQGHFIADIEVPDTNGTKIIKFGTTTEVTIDEKEQTVCEEFVDDDGKRSLLSKSKIVKKTVYK